MAGKRGLLVKRVAIPHNALSSMISIVNYYTAADFPIPSEAKHPVPQLCHWLQRHYTIPLLISVRNELLQSRGNVIDQRKLILFDLAGVAQEG